MMIDEIADSTPYLVLPELDNPIVDDCFPGRILAHMLSDIKPFVKLVRPSMESRIAFIRIIPSQRLIRDVIVRDIII